MGLRLLDTVAVSLPRHCVVGVILRLRPTILALTLQHTHMVIDRWYETEERRRQSKNPGNLPQFST